MSGDPEPGATGEKPDLDRSDLFWAAGLGAALFVLYALGACRTIYVGDSGELVTAIALLGVPHPSGYPLYVLLGKLWTLLLPVGSIALRMSLMSAACASGAAAGLYLLARSARLDRFPALFGALLVATGPSFWSQANIQRVYSLNALFLVAALGAAWTWYRQRYDRFLVLTAFLVSLGATNHTFMAVFAAACALFVLFSEPGVLRRPRTLAAVAAAAALGLSPYLYLPLRSRADPRLDWGDPETLDRFLDVVLRRGFWHRRYLEGPADLLPIVADYLRGLGTELTWLGVALAIAGLAAARRRRWPLALLGLLMLANLGSMALHGSRSDLFLWHRYYIPSYLAAALLAAAGWQWVVDRIGRPRLAPAALLLPLALLLGGFRDFDRSRYRLGEEFSRMLLGSLPPGANLAASDDNILFVLLYLHFVEGVRPDVNLILQGVGEADLPPLRFDPDDEGLYFTHHPNWRLPELEVVPVGLVFKVIRAQTPWPPPVIPAGRLAGASDPRVPKDYLTQNLIGHFHYMLGITWERRDWLRARVELEQAAASAPNNDVLFYNLGLIYRRNGLDRRAQAAFERSHAINPRHLASSTRTRASDRIDEVKTERARLDQLESLIVATEGLGRQGIPPASYHRRLALGLEHRGEVRAARGHRLLSLEAAEAAGVTVDEAPPPP